MNFVYFQSLLTNFLLTFKQHFDILQYIFDLYLHMLCLKIKVLNGSWIHDKSDKDQIDGDRTKSFLYILLTAKKMIGKLHLQKCRNCIFFRHNE